MYEEVAIYPRWSTTLALVALLAAGAILTGSHEGASSLSDYTTSGTISVPQHSLPANRNALIKDGGWETAMQPIQPN